MKREIENAIGNYYLANRNMNVRPDIADRNTHVLNDFFNYLETADYEVAIIDKRKK